MKTEDTQSDISGSLIIFVDIIFGVVVAESFALYRDSLFHPSLPPSPIFVGLLTVYIVTVMSWIGYHSSVTKYPYKNSNLAKLRFSIDLVIVAMYAYLFYSVGTFETNPDLSSYLLGFPIIFTLYIVSGLIKRKEYNDEVSKQRLLLACLFVFILMYCIYRFLVLPLWFSCFWPLKWVFILLPLIVNAEYRRRRGVVSMKIGVDIDGVLADQVSYILGLVNQKYGLELKKSDIKMWNQPIPNTDTDIEKEIEYALLDSNYILTMPVIEGAVKSLRLLSSAGHFIMVVSDRPRETEEATLKWLQKEQWIFHDFRNTRGLSREFLPIDILVDDKLENVKAFARRHVAILFSQPWNQDHKSLNDLIEQGRVICANGWPDVVSILKSLGGIMLGRKKQ